MRILLAAVLLMRGVQTPAEEYRCTYSRKVECSDTGQCAATEVGGAFLLIPHPDTLVVASRNARLDFTPAPQIRRCDNRGCSPFRVDAIRSGAFINVSLTGGGYFLKIAAEPMEEMKRWEFVESATSFLATVTYWGACSIP